jgi:hypothetical protein
VARLLEGEKHIMRPFLFKIIIRCRFSNEETEDVRFVLAFSKNEAEARILPVLKRQEKRVGYLRLAIKQIIKFCPVDYLTDAVVEHILNVNYAQYHDMKQSQEAIEKNPPTYSKPTWIPGD